VDRELTRKLTLRVGYESRKTTGDFLVTPQFNTATETGELLLSNQGRSSYRELHFVTRYRLQEKRELNFAYVRSRATGDLNDLNTYFGDLRAPVIRANQSGRLGFDTPNRFLFWGNFGLPLGISALPVLEWHTGFPYSILNEEQNFVGARNGAGRLPSFASLDMQVMKDVSIPVFGKHYKGRVGFKVFNVTNHWNPREVQSNLGSPDFGTFYNSVGRQFRIKFEFLTF
jgi:hypothetical protein